jgi:hypothetical protein
MHVTVSPELMMCPLGNVSPVRDGIVVGGWRVEEATVDSIVLKVGSGASSWQLAASGLDVAL